MTIESAKAIAVILLATVPLASVIAIYFNRKQRNTGIGGRAVQYGVGMSIVSILAISILLCIATWEAVEKLLFALVAFAAGAWVAKQEKQRAQKK